MKLKIRSGMPGVIVLLLAGPIAVQADESKLAREVQARTPRPSPQLVFSGSADRSFQDFPLGVCISGAQVTITVPTSGTIKVDAQALFWREGSGTIHLFLESTSTECSDAVDPEGGYSPWVWNYDVACGPACVYQERQMSLSRTFKVATAGTYTYYLNAQRDLFSFAGGGSTQTTMQALYFPDL